MTVRFLCQSTHLKVSYKEASDDEIAKSEEILVTTFRAEDSTLKRTWAVKKGFASAVRSFYIQDVDDPKQSKNLLPVGFLPWVEMYFEEANIDYEVIEMREWPKIDKQFVEDLYNNKVVLESPSGEKIIPRDYQIEAVLKAVQARQGIIQSPVGCLAGDTIINYSRQKYGRKNTIEHLYKAHNGLYKNWKYNFDFRPTFVRSLTEQNYIQLNEIDDVVYSGVKDLYLLTLENGNQLKATAEHLIMTKRGWIETIKLLPTDEVMCDTLHAVKTKTHKIKMSNLQIIGLQYHPYARKNKCTKRHGGSFCIDGYTKKMDKHRLIYEAHINNLSYNEYINILRTDQEKSKTLQYIDPSIYDIHHIDENHKNNNVDNLIHILKKDHKILHSQKNKYNFGQGIPQWSRVKNIQYWGQDHTYDICCIKNHNFVANGMIVHNSGKGLMLALLCRIYSDQKILCLMNSIDLTHQTYDNLIKYGFPKEEIGIIQGQNFQDDRRITIISVASYEKAAHLYPEIKVILVDESHELGSGTGEEMSTKILYSCQNAPVRIGLSATADAIDNPFRQMAEYGNLGPIVFDQHIQDKISEGSLSNVEIQMYTISGFSIPSVANWADSYKKTKITSKKQKQQAIDEDKEIIVEEGREYIRELIELGNESNLFVYNEIRNNKIVEIAKQYKHTLILYTRREHGIILYNKLKKIVGEQHIRRIDGLDKKEIRENAKEFLLADSKNIVLASGIFDKGVDIPWIHTLMVVGGGISSSRTIQKFGRSTRVYEGKDKAIVIDFMDRFNKIAARQSEKRFKVYEDKLKFKVEIK